jgi:hypothetical protein
VLWAPGGETPGAAMATDAMALAPRPQIAATVRPRDLVIFSARYLPTQKPLSTGLAAGASLTP